MEMKSQILMRFLRCQICLETLVNPVSLNCNHSFCQDCLTQYLNQAARRDCAVCKRDLPKETPGINISLKEIADSFAGRPEMAKTQKYDVVCLKHPKKPTWFCLDEGITLCEECQHPLQHAGHKLKRVKEAVEKVKDKLQSTLERMEEQLDECIYADEVYKEMVAHMASQRAATEGRIKEEFKQLYQLLREEEEARLAAVRAEEEEKRKLIDRELDIIQGQMLTLENAIHQVENDLKQDSLSFLKDYARTMSRAQCLLKDPQLLKGALIDEANHLGNLKYRVLEKMMEKRQYSPVLLDPNTAAGWVVLSEDLTSVSYMTPKRDLPNNPERFMEHAIVLGSEGFTSGKHTWEVNVGNRVKWVIGVARESVDRKEDCYLKPCFGIWALWKQGDDYRVTGKTLSLQSAPQRITVELDYERGHVTFFDTRDMSLLFEYKDRFKDKMFPYFNTQVDTSETPIILCPINEVEINHF